jgi:putative ABC transport system ATP-binding protein
MKMSAIIKGENIVKAFGEGEEKRNVLDGVTISIDSGEFVAVMGPSGSGKSTLMYALSGMDGVDGGEVSFDGMPLSGYSEKQLADVRRGSMGFVFQQPTMLKNLNLLDNIILPVMRDSKDSKAASAKAKELMEKVGISGLEDRGTAQVSGGQLQRAGICRALMGDPKIIFCDEPTGALNSKSVTEIMDILTMLSSEGVSLMVVTHDAKVAARASRVLFMKDGKIADELTIGEYKEEASADRTMKVMQIVAEIEG